ncbi:MAG TPA: DUF6298 domain-containing protein, partial [Flavisolibacter sp.]
MHLSSKFFFLLPLFLSGFCYAQKPGKPAIDFSHAGYGGGGKALPQVAAVLTIQPTGGDDTRLLQEAVNQIGKLPVQKNGFRGALLLPAKTFRIAGQLRLNKSGVVLRGSKKDSDSTRMIATGIDRRTLILAGADAVPVTDDSITVIDDIVLAGAYQLTLQHTSGLKIGDRITITRPSTKEWIQSVGMDTAKGAFANLRIHWWPRSRDLTWDRTIVAIDKAKNQITVDAPVTVAIEKKFGGALVAKTTVNNVVNNIGIENLSLISEYNKSQPKDEEHAWIGIQVENAEDVFIRNISAYHFVASAVRVGHRGRRVTISNCRNLQPVSEVGGYRRQSFLVEGQQVLVYNCFAENGMNDFAAGLCSGGPNVFLNCSAKKALDWSGSFESWNAGVLYENVTIDGAGLKVDFDMARSQGGGWTAANSLLWNCKATSLIAGGHPSAPNENITSAAPLYAQQLKTRTGKELTALLRQPAPTFQSVKTFVLPAGKPLPEATELALQIVNGRFVIGNKTAWGGSVNDAWWMGQTSPSVALDAGISITRFVPGRAGPGLTE